MYKKNFVALMGTKGGPAIRPGSTMPTSSLISLNDNLFVVDCGLGVTRGLVDQNIELKALSNIIISHLHSDHYLELGSLIHTAWTAGLKQPVTVWGPEGLQDYWDGFCLSMKADIDIRIQDEGRPDLRDFVSIKTIHDGNFLTQNGVTLAAKRNIHPPLTDSFAFSFKSEQHHVVFSADTAYMPELADFAKDADLLIHEAMLEPALKALCERVGNGDYRLMEHLLRAHTRAQDAGKIAHMAGVKSLALHHLIPSDDPNFTVQDWKAAVEPHYQGQLYIGTDGMRIDLP